MLEKADTLVEHFENYLFKLLKQVKTKVCRSSGCRQRGRVVVGSVVEWLSAAW